MARKLSRRSIATYVAGQLADGAEQVPLVMQLAGFLIETGRTGEVDLLVRDIELYLSEKGHLTGTIITAHQLSAATKQAIEAYAKQKTGATTVTLDAVQDTVVLGGLKLQIPGHELDMTIARQLMTLKTRHKKA